MDKYRWVVAIDVDPKWVADGFDLTAERLADMLQRFMPHATSEEIQGVVLSAPDPKQIRCEQGYNEPGYRPRLEE